MGLNDISNDLNAEKQIWIDRLEKRLNGYSNDIPQERVTGQRTHKVNTAWFQGSASTLRRVADGLNDTQLIADIRSFGETFSTRRKAAEEATQRGEQIDNFCKTTREEIDAMDALLRRGIEGLKA